MPGRSAQRRRRRWLASTSRGPAENRACPRRGGGGRHGGGPGQRAGRALAPTGGGGSYQRWLRRAAWRIDHLARDADQLRRQRERRQHRQRLRRWLHRGSHCPEGSLSSTNSTLLLEPIGGISGDLFLGAMADLGLGLAALEKLLGTLG